MSDNKNKSNIKPLYAEIKKRLKSHFKSLETIQNIADNKGKDEGAFMREVNDIIYDNFQTEDYGVTDLAKAMLISRTQLHRKITSLSGMSAGRYIRYVRLSEAKRLLESGECNVSEAAWKVGFVSASHFARVFQKQYGFKPSSIKK